MYREEVCVTHRLISRWYVVYYVYTIPQSIIYTNKYTVDSEPEVCYKLYPLDGIVI